MLRPREKLNKVSVSEDTFPCARHLACRANRPYAMMRSCKLYLSRLAGVASQEVAANAVDADEHVVGI